MNPSRFQVTFKRPAELIKELIAAAVAIGLLATLAFAERSPVEPQRFDVDPSVADKRMRAVAGVQTSSSATEASAAIDVKELRHQQLAIHG